MPTKRIPQDEKDFDLNHDNVVTDEEIKKRIKIEDAKNRDQKEDQLRMMAWVAMASMVLVTILVFAPFVSEERITAFSDLISTFYVAQAGVVAAFFGASAFVKNRRNQEDDN